MVEQDRRDRDETSGVQQDSQVSEGRQETAGGSQQDSQVGLIS